MLYRKYKPSLFFIIIIVVVIISINIIIESIPQFDLFL